MRGPYIEGMNRELAAWADSMQHDPVVGSVIVGDASRDGYVRFLWSTYNYLRWSGPLLAQTADGLRRRGKYPWLVDLVDTKTAEESLHDAWVLNDLEQCGVNVECVKASADPSAVRAYVQWGQTMAEDGSPAYLGAAYALEFIAMQCATMAAENLRARKAIPNIENAVSFLVGHGDADREHVAVLSGLLGQIEDRRDQEAVAVSAGVLQTLYPQFFRSRESVAAAAKHVEGASSCERSDV